MGTVGVEVSGHLVVPPVFNTGEAEHLGLAGSIPVHLRQISAGEEVGVAQADPRRTVPRTDVLMAHPDLVAATTRHGAATVKAAVHSAQALARTGEIAPDDVVAAARAALPARSTTLRPLLNATGVVVHTNIGRAPLSDAAVDAVVAAAAYVDVEYDTGTGARARRGRGRSRRSAPPCRLRATPSSSTTARLRSSSPRPPWHADREVLVSRGEMVEIGDGFRLPDLIASTGARLREVGTTNRTRLADYAEALGPDTGCILKVHPSNFRVEGFTSAASVRELATLGVPLVVDIGSGLLRADPMLPDEPDATTALADGATLVTASGDKLLGGPQAGLVLGDGATVERLRRHPLARALRVDKLTLAALEATLRGPVPPVTDYLHVDLDRLLARTERLAAAVAGEVVPVEGRVGGGERRDCPFPAGPSRSPRPTPSVCGAARPASSRASSGAAASSTCAASRRPATPTSSGPSWRPAACDDPSGH